MTRLLVVGAILWPMLLAAGWWDRADHHAGWLSSAAYLAAGRICHQRPDRSFQTAGVQWPVCGRCAGLYLAAPLGAIFAIARRRRGVPPLVWLAVAAIPTAVSFVVEYGGVAPVSSLARALAALPLGAVVAAVIVGVTQSEPGIPDHPAHHRIN